MMQREHKPPREGDSPAWAATLLLITMLLGPAAAAAQSPPAPLADPGALARLVRQYGLQAVNPPTPATDFDLPAPAGGRVSLSDYRGNWVLLTFWATWCGPCRSEMPSLEKLHEQKAGAGLTVLGVSLDQQRSGLEAFLDQIGVTFPNVWDENGNVGATYRASSIPLSYLVDPAGRLVALSRGARDWTRLTPLIDGLLELEPPGGDFPPSYRTAGGPVELPTVLEPPTAEVEVSSRQPERGAPFFLDVRLRWAGHFEEYLPLPPQVHLPDGVEQEGMTATTSSSDGRNRVTYRISLRASREGRFALDPVDLRYTPRGETEPVASRLTGPTVEVRPSTVLGLSPRTLALGGGGAAALLLAGGFWTWRRRRTVQREPAGAPLWQEYRRRLDEARALRMRGDGRGAFLALAALETELRGDAAAADAPLAARLEAVRYGGNPPAAEELNPLERRVERLVAALAPDPDQAGRDALRLRGASASDVET